MMTWTSPPYPIYIVNMYAHTTTTHFGDCINLCVNKDFYAGPVAGDIQADVAAAATVISVHPGIVPKLFTGLEIALDDGTNKDLMGEIIDVDTANAKIKMSIASTNAFLAATPTKVLITSHAVNNLWIGHAGELSLGKYFDDATRLEPQTVVSVSYQNTDLTTAKELIVNMEVKHGSQNINSPL